MHPSSLERYKFWYEGKQNFRNENKSLERFLTRIFIENFNCEFVHSLTLGKFLEKTAVRLGGVCVLSTFSYDSTWYKQAIFKLRNMGDEDRNRIITNLPSESRRKTVTSDIAGGLEKRQNKISTELINIVCSSVFGTDIDGNIYKLLIAQTVVTEADQSIIDEMCGEFVYSYIYEKEDGEHEVDRRRYSLDIYELRIWKDEANIYRFENKRTSDITIHHSGFVIKIGNRVYCLGIGPYHIRTMVIKYVEDLENHSTTAIFNSYVYDKQNKKDGDILSKRVVLYSKKHHSWKERSEDFEYVYKRLENRKDYPTTLFA